MVKKRRSKHDKILMYSARLALTIMCTCLCLMDSSEWVCVIAFIIAIACAGYLAAYAYANRDYKGGII